MEPILKINLGIVQCWMIMEIALRIRQDLMMHDQKQMQPTSLKNIDCFIKYGRKAMIYSIIFETTAIMVFLLTLQIKTNGVIDRRQMIDRAFETIGWSFLVLGIVLFISVSFLIKRLK